MMGREDRRGEERKKNRREERGAEERREDEREKGKILSRDFLPKVK